MAELLPLAHQQPQPVLIPISIHNDDIPEWAMIEVNGELLPPLLDCNDHTAPAEGSTMLQLDAGTVELGAVHFRDKVG